MKHIDPVLLLLFWGMFAFTGILLFAEWRFHDDGQIFQVLSGLVTAFGGAFFMRVKPQAQAKDDKPQPVVDGGGVPKVDA